MSPPTPGQLSSGEIPRPATQHADKRLAIGCGDKVGPAQIKYPQNVSDQLLCLLRAGAAGRTNQIRPCQASRRNSISLVAARNAPCLYLCELRRRSRCRRCSCLMPKVLPMRCVVASQMGHRATEQVQAANVGTGSEMAHSRPRAAPPRPRAVSFACAAAPGRWWYWASAGRSCCL
jgi:hypothetical protein